MWLVFRLAACTKLSNQYFYMGPDMHLKSVLVISAIVLSGCATSSGVMQIGKDTYSLTVQAESASTAKQKSVNEANEYCKIRGNTLEVQQTRAGSDAYGWHMYEVNFKCTN